MFSRQIFLHPVGPFGKDVDGRDPVPDCALPLQLWDC